MLARPFAVLAIVAGTLTTIAGSAAAEFVSPSSWTRGDGGATYQFWEGFSDDDGSSGSPITDSTPNTVTNPNGAPVLVADFSNQTSPVPGPGIAGSGAIYGAFNDTAITVTIPESDVGPPIAPAHNVTAVVQLRTSGTEMDYDSLTLNGIAPAYIGFLSRSESPNPFPDPTPIADAEVWALFNVPYDDFGDGTPGPQDLSLYFESAAKHFSLQALSVDTAISPVNTEFPTGFYPEPTQGEALGGSDLAGDYNDSGSVEQGDLDLVLNNWGQTRPFDANTDTFATANVDQEELDRVLNNWGSSNAPSFGGASVPEPTTAIALLGLVGLTRRRRTA